MIYDKLGNTDLKVSKICLGTMTWGEQNTEAEGHEQMNYALANGVNFFDTAEMYSVPSKKETFGSTEKIIGTWFKKTGNRDKVVLASKISGPGAIAAHVRKDPSYSKVHLIQAIDASLKRLQTDYIDLYQLHWPERSTNFFGGLSYEHKSDEIGTDFKEVLEGLSDLIKAGKIRHIGISNETPWGMANFLHIAKMYDLPKMQSIQNPYSLLNRTFEVGLAEMAIREKTGLLAYSPLGFGTLSGKYLDAQPKNARVTLYPRFARYSNLNAVAATRKYVDLAKSEGLTPTQMALAYVNSRPFVTSNIIGATTMAQLKENIASIDVKLSDNVLEKIEAIHSDAPNPSP